MVWIKSIVARAASAPQQRLLALALLLLLAVGLIVRLTLASMMPHPGGSDFAFYYTVAENLVDGRGFQVDYIWNYLSAPETITHSSNDYWMPLTSLLISLPMSVLGKTIFVALLPSILTGLVLAVATYYLGKNYSDSNLVGLAAAFLTLFTPPLFHYSLRTDSTVYYALLCLSSLCLMTKGRDDPAFFLLAAACVGLAHLTRQDGVLLVVVLLAAILLAPLNRRAKFAYMLLSVVLYALILAPLLVSNYRSFGRLLPPGPAKTMYLQEYEDLYSYSKDLSLETFLDWGVDEIILSRMNALLTNAKTIYLHLGQAMSVLAVVGIG